MNKVVLEKEKKDKWYYSPSELKEELTSLKMKTAFIGEIEASSDVIYEGLFLISFDCIILAEDPTKTWGTHITKDFIKVDRFVNVEIRVMNNEEVDELENK